jgi:bifunctional DNase/RNase
MSDSRGLDDVFSFASEGEWGIIGVVRNSVVPVSVKAVFPAKAQGCGIFLGNDEKCFVIYVDAAIGMAISMFLQKIKKQRPLTHDLIGLIFAALDVKLERVVINDLREGTYFARLVLSVKNEVHQKVLEIDARPSDSIALAAQAGAPIFVAQSVWDEVDDASEILEALAEESRKAAESLSNPSISFLTDEESDDVSADKAEDFLSEEFQEEDDDDEKKRGK